MKVQAIAQLRDKAVAMALTEVKAYRSQNDIKVDDIATCATEHSVWEIAAEAQTDDLTAYQIETMLMPMVKRELIQQM